MKISLNWLKQYVDLPADLDPKELGLKLTMSTVEVEDIIFIGESFNKIVVGQIKEIVKHPDADKLKVCQVDIGQSARAQIVCGGVNLTENMFCVVALPGAKVKWHGQGELVELKETKIRGVSSYGMICASVEVGLANQYPAKNEVEVINLGDGQFTPGQSIAAALQLEDVIYDIDNKSLTHRPDLWSHYGMARELSAIYDIELKPLDLDRYNDGSKTKLKVSVANTELCPRYQAVVISGIEVKQSPDWLRHYLESVGVRSINNIVDITNYILLDLGQPMHAFDLDKIAKHTISVRLAKKNEKLIVLDGTEIKLLESDLVIADADKAIALAGVMGGKNTEVMKDSISIVLESANFNATNVRKSALTHSLRTEASARFEKCLDPHLTQIALNKAVRLIKECCPTATVDSKTYDLDKSSKKKIEIKTSVKAIQQKIGVAVPADKMVSILESLQFTVELKKDNLKILVPSWRATKDIKNQEDIVEEIARIYGYDQIADDLPAIKMVGADINKESRAERTIRRILAQDLGYNEVYNYSWQSEKMVSLLGLDITKAVELKNYLAPDQRYLRLSMVPNLLNNLQDNLRWYRQINIFEIGRIYNNKPGSFSVDNAAKKYLPSQPKMLAWLSYSDKSNELFFKLKGEIDFLTERLNMSIKYKELAEHKYLLPSKRLSIYYQDEKIGEFGILSSSIAKQMDASHQVGLVEIDLTKMVKYIADKKLFRSLPKYPVVTKDFSVVLHNDSKWQEVEKELLKVDHLIKEIELFDKYFNKDSNQLSIAFHVRLYNETKTLTTEEINKVSEKIIKTLDSKFKLKIKRQ